MLPAEKFQQDIAGGMWMSFVLTESFAVLDADFVAALAAPATTGFGVFVHTMLPSQPFSLTGVTGQCFEFCFKLLRDVQNEVAG
jgi:hypothetical protein